MDRTDQLTRYAERLTQLRDDALDDARQVAELPELSMEYKARASAYRLALDSLCINTHGAFGCDLTEQPDVYATA